MNIYKVPNLIIRLKCKVYRRGVGWGVLNDESVYTHTYTLSLFPSFPPLSLPPPSIHTYIYHSVRKRRLLGRERMCL